MRDDQVHGVQQRGAGHAVRVRQSAHLVQHLAQVALGERADLGPVDGDVVVELRVGPDDRVHLRHGPAGISLQHLDIRGGAGGRGADHEGGSAVAKDHPRRAHRPDLVGELLPAHDEDGALDFLQEAHGLAEPVRQSRAGGHDVAGRVGLKHAELPGEPRGQRRHHLGARAGTKHHRADLLGPAPRFLEGPLGRQERHVVQVQLGV